MSELYVEAPRPPRSSARVEHRASRNTDRGMIDVRGHATDRSSWRGEKILGLICEDTARSVSWGDGESPVASIDQWLILCSRAKAVELTAALKTELENIHHLLLMSPTARGSAP